MSDEYDRHELKTVRHGLKIEKVIAAYQHFGSLRKAAKACGISKDTVVTILKRSGVAQTHMAVLPDKASYNPLSIYSKFAVWHKDHAHDKNLPSSIQGLAKLAGVSCDTVKCYFYRRRKIVSDMLKTLPDLRKLELTLIDIEGNEFNSKRLLEYKYEIDRYSERANVRGTVEFLDPAYEVIVPIASVEQFVRRVKAIATSSRVSSSRKGKPSSSRPSRAPKPSDEHNATAMSQGSTQEGVQDSRD